MPWVLKWWVSGWGLRVISVDRLPPWGWYRQLHIVLGLARRAARPVPWAIGLVHEFESFDRLVSRLQLSGR